MKIVWVEGESVPSAESEWVGNVSYHEAWECGRPNKFDGIHMNILSKVYWDMENEKKQLKFDFMGD
jgi:hypothetical protein